MNTDEPQVVLGTMDFGTRVDRDRAFAILDSFVDGGGVWLDTANCYPFWSDPRGLGGASERVVGAWLRSRPGARDAVRVATKVRQDPLVAHAWPGSAEGLSARAVHAGAQGASRGSASTTSICSGPTPRTAPCHWRRPSAPSASWWRRGWPCGSLHRAAARPGDRTRHHPVHLGQRGRPDAGRALAVAGGGHTWPGADSCSGGGQTTQTIEAHEVLWRFLKHYHLP